MYMTTRNSASLSENSTAWQLGMVLQNTMVFLPDLKSPLTICSTMAILSTLPGQSTNLCLRLGADLCRLGVSIL